MFNFHQILLDFFLNSQNKQLHQVYCTTKRSAEHHYTMMFQGLPQWVDSAQ